MAESCRLFVIRFLTLQFSEKVNRCCCRCFELFNSILLMLRFLIFRLAERYNHNEKLWNQEHTYLEARSL